MKLLLLTTLLSLFILTFDAAAQRPYPPDITGANEVTYKSVDGTDLRLWIFTPPRHSPEDSAPAIVFFFGGGWNAGSPAQFVKHCEYLASRGMVAMVADYRVRSRHDVPARVCVADAKSAVRWIRGNASDLGIDPDRIAAGGGSAGGHLAAACATLPEFDEEDEDLSISSRPNALVLFNPAVVLAPTEGLPEQARERLAGLEKRLGTKPEKMSPYHNLDGSQPPTIIFHGTADTTVPVRTVELFRQKMSDSGNSCMLVAYQGEPHGFFNYGKKSNALFMDTVHRMDEFLVSLGYLKAPPKVEVMTK